jgi:hypothetical protein
MAMVRGSGRAELTGPSAVRPSATPAGTPAQWVVVAAWRAPRAARPGTGTRSVQAGAKQMLAQSAAAAKPGRFRPVGKPPAPIARAASTPPLAPRFAPTARPDGTPRRARGPASRAARPPSRTARTSAVATRGASRARPRSQKMPAGAPGHLARPPSRATVITRTAHSGALIVRGTGCLLRRPHTATSSAAPAAAARTTRTARQGRLDQGSM